MKTFLFLTALCLRIISALSTDVAMRPSIRSFRTHQGAPDLREEVVLRSRGGGSGPLIEGKLAVQIQAGALALMGVTFAFPEVRTPHHSVFSFQHFGSL